MITRLLDSVRALASADAGGAPLAEAAHEFADAYMLASDCPQVRLSADEADALRALDKLLAEDDVDRERLRATASRTLQYLEAGHTAS
jgi:hypothetical protein